MHQLTSSFILGYPGCDETVAGALLRGEPFQESNNAYDWLGPGIYFWGSNPKRGLEFARETSERRSSSSYIPAVIGAVIDLGLCLDLTTSSGIGYVKVAFKDFWKVTKKAGKELPKNSKD